ALFYIADVHLATHEMSKDPFLQYLVMSTSKTIPLEAERHFALLLLRRLQSQIQQMSPVAFLSSFRESRQIVPEDLADFEAAARQLTTAAAALNPMKSIAISNSISSFQQPQRTTGNSITVKGDEIPVPNLMPEFPRPSPRPSHFIQDDFDHMWLDLYPHHELIWDYSKDSDVTREAEVKQLMARAMEETLPVANLDTLLQLVKDDLKLIAQCELSPKRFPELVEKNPQIATEVLLNMMSSPKITE
ncbi:hypothetical protein BVRB_023780, partial [Beta vulgaris subsp. vulgaris]